MSSDWKSILKEAKDLFEEGLIDEEDRKSMIAEAMALRKSSSIPPKNIQSNPLGGSQGTVIQPPSSNNPLDGEDLLGGDNPSGVHGYGTVIHNVDDQMGEGSHFDSGQGTIIGLTKGMQVGNWIVQQQLGEGGMGFVYKGRHCNNDIASSWGDAAIKIMKPQYAKDPIFKERFLREASIGRKYRHQYIADCLEIVNNGQHLALIMSYIEGHDLKELIQNGGMTLDEALKYAKPIAEALDYLHSHNIIHRDIKPENIKITPAGTPIILDMGIAKDMSSNSSQTITGTGMGTLTYMAPEQSGNAKSVDGRADQYALGMIVYEMLSGRKPWSDGETDFNIIGKKVSNQLDILSTVANVSKHISDKVHKSLRSDKNERFDSCVAFIDSLSNTSDIEMSSRQAFSAQEIRYKSIVVKLLENGILDNKKTSQLVEVRKKLNLSDDFHNELLTSLTQSDCPISLSILEEQNSFIKLFSNGQLEIKILNTSNLGEEVEFHYRDVNEGCSKSFVRSIKSGKSNCQFSLQTDLSMERYFELMIKMTNIMDDVHYYAFSKVPFQTTESGLEFLQLHHSLLKKEGNSWVMTCHEIDQQEFEEFQKDRGINKAAQDNRHQLRQVQQKAEEESKRALQRKQELKKELSAVLSELN